MVITGGNYRRLLTCMYSYYTAGTLRVGSHVREVPQRKEKQVAVEGLHQNKAVCQLDRATSYQFRLFVWNTKSFVGKITKGASGSNRGMPPGHNFIRTTQTIPSVNSEPVCPHVEYPRCTVSEGAGDHACDSPGTPFCPCIFSLLFVWTRGCTECALAP